jgi:hypothetical protein
MPPIEERKRLLIALRGTPQQKDFAILCCDPRLPCYGVIAFSRCGFGFLSYFLPRPQKVPNSAESSSPAVNGFRLHSRLDVRGARPVSAKGIAFQQTGSMESE